MNLTIKLVSIKKLWDCRSKIADELEGSMDYFMGKTDLELDRAIVNPRDGDSKSP